MTYFEDECVDCGLPCLGNSCSYRNVPHTVCDKCKEEDYIYEFEGDELCMDCILETLDKSENEICDDCGDMADCFIYDGKSLCASCIENMLDEVNPYEQ